MSNVRVGVVGAGNMGADRVTTLHRHVSGAEVTLVVDIDKERGGLRRRYGARRPGHRRSVP
jgi:predicted homoserine dehydrogenase-like protein